VAPDEDVDLYQKRHWGKGSMIDRFWHKTDLGNQADDVRFRGQSRPRRRTARLLKMTSERTRCRRSAQRVPSQMPTQGTPMTDREKILIALREKPLKAFEIMKRVNIKHQDDCQSLLLKMRDDGAVKFDIHKGHWLAA
jgi:hypothetical protein